MFVYNAVAKFYEGTQITAAAIQANSGLKLALITACSTALDAFHGFVKAAFSVLIAEFVVPPRAPHLRRCSPLPSNGVRKSVTNAAKLGNTQPTHLTGVDRRVANAAKGAPNHVGGGLRSAPDCEARVSRESREETMCSCSPGGAAERTVVTDVAGGVTGGVADIASGSHNHVLCRKEV